MDVTRGVILTKFRSKAHISAHKTSNVVDLGRSVLLERRALFSQIPLMAAPYHQQSRADRLYLKI
jgi:hypothetical protein